MTRTRCLRLAPLDTLVRQTLVRQTQRVLTPGVLGVVVVLATTARAPACNDCGCTFDEELQDDVPDDCRPAASLHTHDNSTHQHLGSAQPAGGAWTVYSNPAAGAAPAVRFAVIGDTQGGEFGGHSNILSRLSESVAAHDVDYVLFPGDLVADTGSSGWSAWKSRTSVLGTNSLGRDRRLMTPGNHDRGSGGTYASWQQTFDWLPNSQSLNGQQGIDQVDYYLDHENVRFVSISTDAPGDIYNGRQVNHAPPGLDWLREVFLDVDARNADADPENDIDHVFTFSHRAVTTQLESPTGGTDGAWWQSMTGQDSQGGNHAATAFLAGHWHMYQPSRPDPNVDTMEIISGTGGGGLEAATHRNWHGYSVITVEGGSVTSEFYGDANQSSDSWNFELLDQLTIADAGGLPTGELAFYGFPSRLPIADTSSSSLSKHHPLSFQGSAASSFDPLRGDVLRVLGDGNSYADAKNVGDNNLAVLGDLTIAFAAKAATLDSTAGDNTLLAFGGAHGSANGSLNNQESANHAYKVALTAAGNLQIAWQHDDASWETITSNDSIADPLVWHDYEIRRDADSLGVAFFVDGNQLGQTLPIENLPTGGGSGSLYLGAGVGGALDFDGWMDDVRLANDPVTLTPIILGDFDSSGTIDGADWALFADGLGTSGSSPTDLDGDGVTGYLDFLAFQQIYDQHHGAGALLRLPSQIPEPCTALLGMTTIAVIYTSRRARLTVIAEQHDAWRAGRGW